MHSPVDSFTVSFFDTGTLARMLGPKGEQGMTGDKRITVTLRGPEVDMLRTLQAGLELNASRAVGHCIFFAHLCWQQEQADRRRRLGDRQP
jgi:hypothetical protein